mgnify:CR=1 FL=1
MTKISETTVSLSMGLTFEYFAARGYKPGQSVTTLPTELFEEMRLLLTPPEREPALAESLDWDRRADEVCRRLRSL